MKPEILVIGAGASGLLAAGAAAKNGAKVKIFETMARPARKLRICGKGRCNLTNTASYKDFLNHFNNKGRFLKSSFKTFFNEDIMQLVESLGVPLKEERGGRVFPKSDKAIDVVDALVKWARKSGASILTETPISGIITRDEKCVGVRLKKSKKEVFADAVILCTGGKSYPLTGSTGDGYNFARQLGHTIVPLSKSLVALKTCEKFPSDLCGNTIKNVKATLLCNNKKIAEEFGEMFFQADSLGGPIIITLSRLAVPLLNSENKVEISLDLKPALEHAQLDKRLLRELSKKPDRDIKAILGSLLPSQMIQPCLSINNLDGSVMSSVVNAKTRKTLKNWFKDFRFTISEPRPWEEAIITSGGIDTSEVNPLTMESKLIKNLYFAGEILNIDADTGGFNLQAAFSTGWSAGIAASKSK